MVLSFTALEINTLNIYLYKLSFQNAFSYILHKQSFVLQCLYLVTKKIKINTESMLKVAHVRK